MKSKREEEREKERAASYLRDGVIGRGNSKCKGPGAMCLVCSRCSVAGVGVSRRVAKVREGLERRWALWVLHLSEVRNY